MQNPFFVSPAVGQDWLSIYPKKKDPRESIGSSKWIFLLGNLRRLKRFSGRTTSKAFHFLSGTFCSFRQFLHRDKYNQTLPLDAFYSSHFLIKFSRLFTACFKIIFFCVEWKFYSRKIYRFPLFVFHGSRNVFYTQKRNGTEGPTREKTSPELRPSFSVTFVFHKELLLLHCQLLHFSSFPWEK